MTDDNQLIQACLKGDTSAFRTLVSRYQDKMYSVCMSVLKNPAEADEATQDTFIKAFRSLEHFNGSSQFSSWLYKIAYRTSLDYIRKRKKTFDLDNVDAGFIKAEGNRQESMANRELSSLLLESLSHLPSDEAAIVRMFYLEEMTIRELSDIMDMSESNIKVKLYRSRKKLADIIENNYIELKEFLPK